LTCGTIAVMTDRTIDTGTTDVLGEVRDGVGRIVLNRPERRNALTPDMLGGLAALLAELESADDVGAVLLTGAGQAFCAGGDVKAFAERGGEGGSASAPQPERIARQRDSQAATVGRLYGLTKPVVAALPGAAAGAGLGLALAADLRIGCPATVMVTAFARVGLSGDYGTAWLLHRLVGPARAREMLFLSDRVSAEQCRELGLLNRIVPADELADAAQALAARLANGPRLALRNMKQNLVDADHDDLAASMEREIPRHMECGVSEDHREAVQAFVAKREPVFGRTP
jgi:2-(1,2-epoxy-1,2-dihydrophenyl)acetyl-CoA isomerase